MKEIRHLVLGVELEKRTALVLTGGICAAGALVVLMQKVYNWQEAKAKIRKARTRREESLCRAEEAAMQYRKSVRADVVILYKSLKNINI